MSHHARIILKGVDIGYARITNEGKILSIYISKHLGDDPSQRKLISFEDDDQ